MLRAVHVGGLDTILTTYQALFAEVPKRNLTYVGPMHERALVQDEAGRPRTIVRLVVRHAKPADVGIYVDHGAHPNAIRTAAAACIDAGLRVTPLTAASLNGNGFATQVRGILMPGGWAAHYRTDITSTGVKNVARFVQRGGGYVGICAGAFFATTDVRWEGESLVYPLDLMAGVADGPLDAVAPWPGHALAELRLEPGHTLTKGLAAKRQAFYLGGPALHPRDDSGARIVARYTRGNAPAILTTRRGKGRVFLSGVHLEYDLTSDRDDLAWPENAGRLKDPEPDWDLFPAGRPLGDRQAPVARSYEA